MIQTLKQKKWKTKQIKKLWDWGQQDVESEGKKMCQLQLEH